MAPYVKTVLFCVVPEVLECFSCAGFRRTTSERNVRRSQSKGCDSSIGDVGKELQLRSRGFVTLARRKFKHIFDEHQGSNDSVRRRQRDWVRGGRGG